MIAANDIDKMTSDEHSAWLDSLSDDDRMIVFMPEGYLSELIIISQLKRALATEGATVAERMEFLEGLSGLAREPLTAEAVAAVAPACDAAIKMIHEAMTLNTNDMWRLIGRFDVFSEFARLNPSLLAAVKLCDVNCPPPKRACA